MFLTFWNTLVLQTPWKRDRDIERKIAIDMSGLPSLWIRQTESETSFSLEQPESRHNMSLSSVLRGLINPEITVLHSQKHQWLYVFVYLFSHFSLSMFHLLQLPQQSTALFNQEMTTIIKESNNCNDAALLVRLSFPPTQLPTKEGHSSQCWGGILIRIYRPQVFSHTVSGKSTACHQPHIISLVICKGTRILNL